MHQAAQLLVNVPNLVLGKEPGNPIAWLGCLILSEWPAEESLAAGYIVALQPLALRLACMGLRQAPINAAFILSLGRVLGETTHVLCIKMDAERHDGQPTVAVWRPLLTALPFVAVLSLACLTWPQRVHWSGE